MSLSVSLLQIIFPILTFILPAHSLGLIVGLAAGGCHVISPLWLSRRLALCYLLGALVSLLFFTRSSHVLLPKQLAIKQVLVDQVSSLVISFVITGLLVLGYLLKFSLPTVLLHTAASWAVSFQLDIPENYNLNIWNILVELVAVIIIPLLALTYSWIFRRNFLSPDPLTNCLSILLPYSFYLLLPTFWTAFTWLFDHEWFVSDSVAVKYTLSINSFVGSLFVSILLCRMLLINRTKRLLFTLFPTEILEYAPQIMVILPEDHPDVLMGVDTRKMMSVEGDGAVRLLPTTDEELGRVRAGESLVWILITASFILAFIHGHIDIRLLLSLLNSNSTVGIFSIICMCISIILGSFLLPHRLIDAFSSLSARLRTPESTAIIYSTTLSILPFITLNIPFSIVYPLLGALIIVSKFSHQTLDRKALINFGVCIIAAPLIAAVLSLAITPLLVHL